jgi:hypothetical protein
MELIVFIFLVWLCWIIISAIFNWIKQTIDKAIVHKILANFDYEREKNDIFLINKQYDFKEVNSKNSILEAREKNKWQLFIDKL